MKVATAQPAKRRLRIWQIVLLVLAALLLLTLILAIVPNPFSTLLYEHNYNFQHLVDFLARYHLSGVQH
jgi:hypothetical protein